jgi:cytochrome c biogenesis protein CcdA
MAMTSLLPTVRHWLRAAEKRPLSRRNHAGAALALLTCPCHLGVAIVLTSGTALGGWLAAERAWLYALLTIAFASGLALLFRRSPDTCTGCRGDQP